MLIWDYIDLEDAIFNAPAYFTNLMGKRENFTKNGQNHIQVMPTQLVELFKSIKPVTHKNAFALSLHPEKPLSANTLAKVIKQYGWKDERGQGATVHGLRNTLGTWMEDNVGWNEMLRKHTLQHTIESLEKPYLVRKEIARENERRQAMQAWADYVTGG